MILFWFILGFIVAVAIARINANSNNSNKLFWTLFISFLLGIVGGTFAAKLIGSKNKTDLDQVHPTQVIYNVEQAIALGDITFESASVHMPEPVSQGTTPEPIEEALIGGVIIDIPENPPQNQQVCLSILTHRDMSIDKSTNKNEFTQLLTI